MASALMALVLSVSCVLLVGCSVDDKRAAASKIVSSPLFRDQYISSIVKRLPDKHKTVALSAMLEAHNVLGNYPHVNWSKTDVHQTLPHPVSIKPGSPLLSIPVGVGENSDMYTANYFFDPDGTLVSLVLDAKASPVCTLFYRLEEEPISVLELKSAIIRAKYHPKTPKFVHHMRSTCTSPAVFFLALQFKYLGLEYDDFAISMVERERGRMIRVQSKKHDIDLVFGITEKNSYETFDNKTSLDWTVF